MNPFYPEVSLRAGHRCEYCHAPEVVFNMPFEVEHIVPRSLDGADDQTNLALACRSCNLWKHAHINGYDPDSNEYVRLFHPRNDNWDNHFRINHDDGVIIGQTAIGRATITRLRMNDLLQLTARQQWMRLDLFP
jgi:hypothetical protein